MDNTSNPLLEIRDVTDYVIGAFADEPGTLTVLKLQKLLFYIQAWHLATRETPLFAGKFQAWVHGPVNRDVYDRFKDTHSLYSPLGVGSISPGFNPQVFPQASRAYLDELLEAYGSFTGTQLEDMTHKEEPWIQARGTRSAYERCETEISEENMKTFYKSLLRQQ